MTNITTLRPGEHFMFKNFEWVCLDPNHPDGGVLALMAKPWKEDVRFCPDMRYTDVKGNWNNYFSSFIRTDLLDVLADTLGNNLLLHEVDLVADNGDFSYGKAEDPVFILTCDEYRKYREFIPHYDSWIWAATPWYCGDKGSDTGGANNVRIVNTAGRFGIEPACFGYAVTPACVINPESLNLRRNMAYVEETSE